MGYMYHSLALMKKLIVTMVCVLLVTMGEVQLWLLFILHFTFLGLKAIIRPYRLLARNMLVILCDTVYLIVLIMKLNDFYNFRTYNASQQQSQR